MGTLSLGGESLGEGVAEIVSGYVFATLAWHKRTEKRRIRHA